MAEYDNRYAAQPTGVGTRVGTAEGIDAGLRSYMLGVYNYMGLGVAFTAVVSLVMMTYFPQVVVTIAATPLKWVLFAGILGLGWFSPRLILSGSKTSAHAAYWTYAAMWGLLIAPMLLSFFAAGNGGLVFKALAITSVMFFGMSLLGYTTKKDLSGIGQFLALATIGLLVAMVVNAFFIQSGMFGFITSALVVLVFAGITAWETQEIKQMYVAGDEGEQGTGKAIFGAFLLYGSFVTIFIHLLNMLGFMSSD
ncbi:MAG: Bax inhibitor-1/YccA family protein [Pseudomonadota bacterium]